MKRFENEVLTFDTSRLDGTEKMARSLCELGEAGWEVVSVISRDLTARELLVFLKREKPVEVVRSKENAA